MSARPRLSVVIPTRDRPELLQTCLEGFAQQSLPCGAFEVLVVDDGSTEPLDGLSAGFAGRLALQIVRRPPDGVSAARNIGVALARGDHLLLFDDDQYPASDLVQHCLDFHESQPEEGDFLLLRVVPDMTKPREPESFAMFEGTLFMSYPSPGERWGYGSFWGGAVSCKRSIFRYGLYDLAYRMAEDAELGLRINQMLPLTDHFRHDRADAVQMRTMNTRQMLVRWCRLSYFHLIWQRNYPQLVKIGARPAYQNAQAIVARRGPMKEIVAACEAQARAIGPVSPDNLTPPTQAALGEYVVHMRVAVEKAQALGWLAARNDEPFEAVLEREFGAT